MCVACGAVRAGSDPRRRSGMVRLGRVTALSKPDGGVREIVAGDVIRR